MKYITFKELAIVCGQNKAYEALLVIERSAQIRPHNIVVFDLEKRLRRAFDAMREVQLAA